MLGKLLKYDLKWIYKVVVIFYILAFIFSIIGRGLSYIENSVIFGVITQFAFGFAISMMASSLINCVMRLWARFVKSVYKDESYLTHTLPVEKKTIYKAKALAAIITIITTAIVILACLFICYYSEANMQVIKSALEITASTYNTTVLNLLLLVSMVLLLQIIFIVFIGYAGIVLGHKSNQNKMVKSIIISFGFYMIMQVTSVILVFAIGLLNPNIMNLVNTTEAINVETIKYLMYGAMIMYAIYIFFYFLLGIKQFEKGVNVE